MKKLLLLLTFITLVFTGCEKKESKLVITTTLEKPEITLQSSQGSESKFSVTSNKPWEFRKSNNSDWLSVSPMKGGAGTTSIVMQTVSANLESATRIDTIELVAENATQLKISVSQTGILTFDDPALKAIIVAQYDKDGDGEISPDEAKLVTSLNVNNKGLTSLYGIYLFENLSVLNCQNNEFFGLDVTLNSALTLLDCTNNPKLAILSMKRGQNIKIDKDAHTDIVLVD